MKIFEGLDKLGFTAIPDVDLFAKKEKVVVTSGKVEVKEINYDDVLYKKNYVCPVCDKNFTDTTIKKSKIRYKSSDTDLRAIYEPIDPLYYDIILCNKCGYAAMSSIFDKITERQGTKITENISKKFKEREYPLVLTTEMAIERYKFALLNSMIKEAKNGEKGYICLKIAWLYRDLQDTEKEIFFMNNAYKGLQEAYTSEDFPICGLDEASLTYMLGEMARRCGFYSEAMKWMGTVIMRKNINERLKQRALDVKDLLKVEMEKVSGK